MRELLPVWRKEFFPRVEFFHHSFPDYNCAIVLKSNPNRNLWYNTTSDCNFATDNGLPDDFDYGTEKQAIDVVEDSMKGCKEEFENAEGEFKFSPNEGLILYGLNDIEKIYCQKNDEDSLKNFLRNFEIIYDDYSTISHKVNLPEPQQPSI